MQVLFSVFICLLSSGATHAGNKERNLWSSILINKIEDVETHLKDGANPNSKNEVRQRRIYLFHSWLLISIVVAGWIYSTALGRLLWPCVSDRPSHEAWR